MLNLDFDDAVKLKENKIPVKERKITKYHLTRRTMLKELLAFGIISQLPFSYSFVLPEKSGTIKIFSDKQKAMVTNIQQILFPDDGFGPGAKEISAEKYLSWVLSDPRMDPEDQQYIFDGLKWTSETANEKMNKDYLVLTGKQQDDLIQIVSKTDWGESWLSVIMTYILEALLADPQYGGNPEGKGWKWLSHYPGYPRPTEDLLYGQILKTLEKQYEQKER